MTSSITLLLISVPACMSFVLGQLLALQADEGPATPKGRLWVRIQDEKGNPTTARIYLTGPDGRNYVPEGSLARGRAAKFFHARGHFQAALPRGKVQIRAVKGFEYLPASTEVDLEYLELNDRTTSSVITLKRLIDMPAQGWFSGDVHMHPNHRIGGVYITMEDCLVLAEGEDIRVANLLISNRQGTTRVFDTEYFSDGRPDPLSTTETLLVVQEEFRNANGMYGHMPLLGIKKLITPFFTGIVPHWEDYPSNYEIAMQAQDQAGVVSYAHPATELGIPLGLHVAREFPVDLALGAVNALDLLSNMDEEAACWMYYRVLNCGLKCTASAGTDTQMDVLDRDSVPGGSKVYVQLKGQLTYESWIEGYREGRTFVTNGPLLSLDVEGREPGDEIRLSTPTAVTVSAEARSVAPMQVLEIVVNGSVIASAEPQEGGQFVRLEHKLQLDRSSWIAARIWGDRHPLVTNDSRLFAHTSPVYAHLNNEAVSFPEDAKIILRWIDGLIEDVRSSPRFSTEENRRKVLSIFQRGRAYYAKVAQGQSGL